MKQNLFFSLTLLLLCSISQLTFSQTQCTGNIWYEDFNTTKYPIRSATGTNGNSANSTIDWNTNAQDCDDATPFGTSGQSYWGTYNGEFLVNDIEGGSCACSGGGTTLNEFITEVIDISNYCNVSIAMDFRNTGTMELNTSTNSCNNSDDVIQGLYSLNGGPWQQWFFDDGNVNLSPALITNISGSTIQLKILVGNKANDERHFFDNICVSGTLKPQPPTVLCYQTATWNPVICDYDVTGTEPELNVTSSTICNGQGTLVSATATITGGTFIWDNSQTSASINVSPTSTTTYNVLYSLNGCLISGSGTVTVNPIPSVIVNSTTICEGQTASLIAIPSFSGGTYLWIPNGETSETINISPTSTNNYSVVYTLNGCSSQVANGTVNVYAKPEVSFVADQLIGCAPLTVQFTSYGSAVGAYSWSISDGQTLSGENSQCTFSQGGCYDVTLTSTENGCSNTSSVQYYICVENPPSAFFTSNPSQISDLLQPISFINTSVGSADYIWDFSDGQNSEELNPTIFFTNSNLEGVTATLSAISDFGCVSTYSNFISFSQIAAEVNIKGDVYIPNSFTPNSDERNQLFQPVFSDPTILDEFELVIVNRWGEQIFISFDFTVGWDGTSGGLGNPVQDGVYIYVLTYKLKNSKRKKIVGHISHIR